MTGDPVVLAARAIAQVTRLLAEAHGYLEAGETRAAIRLLRTTAQGRRR